MGRKKRDEEATAEASWEKLSITEAETEAEAALQAEATTPAEAYPTRVSGGGVRVWIWDKGPAVLGANTAARLVASGRAVYDNGDQGHAQRKR
jgi:hypothetical protein